jgi:hypothetical protein
VTCPLWGPALDEIASLSEGVPLWRRYELLLKHVAHLFGPEVAIIDSSKSVENLASLVQHFPTLDLRVIHNIRDVRPFTVSMLDNSRRKSRKRELPEKVFYQWFRWNRKCYSDTIVLMKQPPTGIMYEGLCLANGVTVDRLTDALGEQYINVNTALNSGHTHIISGNRSRLPAEGRANALAYDWQWLCRREWLRPYLLMPWIRGYNEQCLREFGGLR